MRYRYLSHCLASKAQVSLRNWAARLVLRCSLTQSIDDDSDQIEDLGAS